jgi:mono/diheme cytochrome c family protein/glucose/arabinose dehydrogenase
MIPHANLPKFLHCSVIEFPQLFVLTCTLGLLATSDRCLAQNGDRPGEIQATLPDDFKRDAALPRSPEEALRSFQLQPGFRIELVASEPMIEDPVAMAFDESGRLWVVEMRGYMNDIEGSDETQPIGRIVVLEDHDGDGRMDRATPFLEGLVLPRAIAPVDGGVLYVEPPHLVFARDLDGDLVADETRIVASGFAGIENPEHAGNGLAWGIDGWLECSQHPFRYRFHDGEGDVELQRVRPHGQWGIAVDDLGRCWYSPNSEPLLVDLHPKHYAARNPNQSGFNGVGQAVATSKRVKPIMRTPGVNRGYQKSTLDDDGKLASFTGACGTGVYRDTILGEDVEGDIFVGEVAGNLVKRFDIRPDEKKTIAAHPVDDPVEFITSTDERFRPVQIITGPDGALYVCDMYRGIIQHQIFMTSFLRKQVEERGLEHPASLGRIWRVVPDDGELRSVPDLSSIKNEELAIFIEHPNGTVRDSAQRLLTERRAIDAAPVLRDTMSNSTLERDRLRALWTLGMIGAVNKDDLALASRDSSSHVRRAALRVAEETLEDREILELCSALASDSDDFVRVQSLLSLGGSELDETLVMIPEIFEMNSRMRPMRSAVLSSLSGREERFLEVIEEQDLLAERTPANRALLADVADSILRSRDRELNTALLAFGARRPEDREWHLRTILDRTGSTMRLNSKTPRKVRVAAPPRGWPELIARGETPIGQRALAIDEHLLWPEREMFLADDVGTSVDFSDPSSVISRGKRIYVQCLSCHQANGRGLYPVYPPLADSEIVLGDPSLLAAIIMHGLEGRIEVQGRHYNQQMPPAPIKDDTDIAAVITYVRQAWGNDASAVGPDLVEAVRKATSGRSGPLGPADIGQ